MKKLYLLLDEWDNDRNFVGGELKLMAEKYDVTVVCNSAEEDRYPNVKYVVYKRPGKRKAVSSILRMFFDREAWEEISRVLKEASRKASKLSETIRFYINADMFREFMKKNGFFENDVIYYSYWYFWKCYAVTHEIDKYPDSRVITRTHEYDLYDYTSPSGYQPFKEPMDVKLSYIIFIAEHGRDYYLRKYDRKACDKYRLYHLGTPLPSVSGKYGTTGVCERSETLTIVSCSAVIERKRVFRIVEALGMINRISIRWTHFGTGDQDLYLRQLCDEKLKEKSNISYDLKGYVKNEELHAFYASNKIDVFVTASSSEGNPVSVMEALSYGIPIIAPAVCNFPNMITDCGILVSGECRAEELAEAVMMIAEMPDEDIRKLRNNARRCWEENFNAEENNIRFVEEVLDTI